MKTGIIMRIVELFMPYASGTEKKSGTVHHHMVP